MIVKFECYMDVDDDSYEEIKKIEHHIDSFVDLDNWQEIKSISSVKITEEKASDIKDWVSVEDSLPKQTSIYLVTVGVSHMGFGMYNEVRMASYNKVFKKFHIHKIHTNIDETYGKVSAWMPLPKMFE